jgi:hypothetical protein
VHNERFEQQDQLIRIYYLAKELQMFDIFGKVYERFEALAPWPPNQLLAFAREVIQEESTGDAGDDALRECLQEHVAKSFPAMIRHGHGRQLLSAMELDRPWASFMLLKLAGVFAGENKEDDDDDDDEGTFDEMRGIVLTKLRRQKPRSSTHGC